MALLLVFFPAIAFFVFVVLKGLWEEVFDKKIPKEERMETLVLVLIATPVAVIGFLFVFTVVYLFIVGE